MSDDYKVNKSKLSFKGETKTKKKKRKAEKPLEEEEDVNANADGWVFVKALTDLGGPLFLTFSSDPPTSLSVDDKSRVVMRPLESDSSSSSTTTPLTLDQAEPTVIQQVFVATMLPDSDRLTLKASNGRYLSSDKFGIVSAETEAIGMQEEWTAIIKPEENGGIALQNHYGKFLSVDEVAAAAGSSTGFQIRADSDVIGYCELFQAKIQAKNRKKAKKSTEVKIATKDYEFEQR
ncbi:hypothetical protein BG004_001259 [Podila humilis]|nr:hypothetical protein BG004_001259 [Podila humilis]